MTALNDVMIPVCVDADQLDLATRFYERLLSTRAEADVDVGNAKLTVRPIGSVLLVAGPDDMTEDVRRLRGIVAVGCLDEVIDTAVKDGAVVVKQPGAIGGRRLAHLKHPDGSIFEYLAI